MSQTAGPWTVRRILDWTTAFFTRKAVDSPRLSAELLLAHVLKVPRIKLYTDFDRPLEQATLDACRGLVQRAGEHEPVAYLTGRANFFNLELDVGPGVLIPRPDTETLVEQVIQLCRHQAGLESPRVLDLCTGSGCIAAAIAANLKTATVFATDISKVAVQTARQNIQRLGLADRVTIEQGDLFEPLSGRADALPFDLVVANPPYIPTGQIAQLDRNVRDYEPHDALDGGADGLAVLRRIVSGAPDRLVPGGRLYAEIAFDQGAAAREITGRSESLDDVRVIRDYAGHDRVLTARRRIP
jgi:release factor glutamine methyltransferase